MSAECQSMGLLVQCLSYLQVCDKMECVKFAVSVNIVGNQQNVLSV